MAVLRLILRMLNTYAELLISFPKEGFQIIIKSYQLFAKRTLVRGDKLVLLCQWKISKKLAIHTCCSSS